MRPQLAPVRAALAEPGPAAGRGPALALLAATQFTVILAISVLNVVLPQVQSGLGMDRASASMINPAYAVPFSGLLLLGGRLAELAGARRVFTAGAALFATASAAAGLAPGSGALLAARFGQGVGAALAVPAAMALVGVLYPEPERRSRVMALWGGLATFGATTGMLLSGAAAALHSWRSAFVVPVVVGAAVAAAAPALLPAGEAHKQGSNAHDPDPRRAGPRWTARLDIPGALTATAGISLLSFGLLRAPDHGWASGTTLALLSGGAALLAAFAAVERRAVEPMLPPTLLADPSRAVALLAVFFGSSAVTSVFFLLPLYFQRVLGYSGPQAAAAFLPFGAALAASGLSASRLVARFGVRAATAGGLGIAAAGLALLGRVGPHSAYVGAILAGLVLLALGVGQVSAGATVAAMANVPPGRQATAGAVVNTALEAGPALGLSAMVAAAAARSSASVGAGAEASGYAFAFTCAAVAYAAGAVLTAVLLRRPPAPTC